MSIDRSELEMLVRKRTPFQHPQVPFIQLWSQKAGCTAVLKWFLWHAGLLDEAIGYKDEEEGISIHFYETEVFRKGPDYQQQLVERILGGAPLVNFMRCPYARAFSSYMHLQNQFFIRLELDGIPNVGLELRKEILRSIYGYDVGIEFQFSFVDYLRWLEGQDGSAIEPHHAWQWTGLYALPGVTHYRLEDFRPVAAALERQYGLPDSAQNEDLFSAGHHLPKRMMNREAVLALAERGIPMNKSPYFEVPVVTRQDLQGTWVGELIEKVMARDIAFYDAIEPFEG